MNKNNTEFPLKLNGVLHRHERILELYQANDLLEIFNLTNLEDTWDSFNHEGKDWDLNLYNNGKTQVLTIYETALTEDNSLLTLSNSYRNIDLIIEK